MRPTNQDLVGKVIHYYDKVGVAVLKLEKELKIGDKIKLAKGENGFEQTVESMQVEHKDTAEGKPGDEVAIKVDQKAKKGTLVYSVL